MQLWMKYTFKNCSQLLSPYKVTDIRQNEHEIKSGMHKSSPCIVVEWKAAPHFMLFMEASWWLRQVCEEFGRNIWTKVTLYWIFIKDYLLGYLIMERNTSANHYKVNFEQSHLLGRRNFNIWCTGRLKYIHWTEASHDLSDLGDGFPGARCGVGRVGWPREGNKMMCLQNSTETTSITSCILTSTAVTEILGCYITWFMRR